MLNRYREGERLEKISHKKLTALIAIILLAAVLITTSLGLSLAFFNKKSTINGSVKFTSGIVLDVKNLSLIEITDLNEVNEAELSLYSDGYNDTTYLTNKTITSQNFSNLHAGDKIRVVSPTIQAYEGTDDFYVRVKFVALYEDPETEELVEATEQELTFLNIKRFPIFDTQNWAFNNSDGYYYNVIQGESEVNTETLYRHFYHSEQDKSVEISLLSSNIEDRSIQIATFNYQESMSLKKIYIALKLEVAQANSTALYELWGIGGEN